VDSLGAPTKRLVLPSQETRDPAIASAVTGSER
jgi:hypothetical protein